MSALADLNLSTASF